MEREIVVVIAAEFDHDDDHGLVAGSTDGWSLGFRESLAGLSFGLSFLSCKTGRSMTMVGAGLAVMMAAGFVQATTVAVGGPNSEADCEYNGN